MPGGWWEGVAEDISAHPQRTVLMRKVLIGAGFAAHLFGVNPHKLSDAELLAFTSSYRLVHIRRTAPRTGRDGPGDWPGSGRWRLKRKRVEKNRFSPDFFQLQNHSTRVYLTGIASSWSIRSAITSKPPCQNSALWMSMPASASTRAGASEPPAERILM